MIARGEFGLLPDGRMVHCYTIVNARGEFVRLLDYGAMLHAVVVLDADGRLGDVVLGASDASSLPTFTRGGATIGRCANRIAFGRFEIDGVQHQLECNMRGHFLHGASGNYAHRLFETEVGVYGKLKVHQKGSKSAAP